MENQPIACRDRLPEEGETVIFWLEPDQGNYSHGSIMVGNFNQAYRMPESYGQPVVYKFSTPGHGWNGTHWLPIPEHLKHFKPE